MFRKTALAAAALVVAAVFFFFVSSSDREGAATKPPSQVASSGPRAPSSRQTIRGGDSRLGGGERPRFNVIDRDTGRVKYEFSAASWDWSSDTLLVMEQPDIRVHMPGGEITQITAKQGEFEVANTGRKDIDPKRGRLWDGVHVVVDRTTRQWREDPDNKSRVDRDKHPEFLIHIDMDEARFDVETSRLAADGPIEIHSEEADLHANRGNEALRLTWNQVDNRIDFLTLKYGGTMELRRDAGLVDFGMPGSEHEGNANLESPAAIFSRRPAGAEAASHAPSSRPAGPPQTADEVAAGLESELNSHAPATLPARPPKIVDARPASSSMPSGRDAMARHAHRKSRQSVVTYVAAFHDKVQVRQLQGTGGGGQLDCDLLQLIFELGSPRREAPSTAPATQPALLRRPAAPRAAPATQPAGPRTRIVLTWTGALEMRPIEAARGDEATGRRFDVLATGQHVTIKDTQGEADCVRMIYRNETRAVWLTGGAPGPAQLTSNNGRKMVAPEIAMERDAGRGFLRGAGLLSDPGKTAGSETLSETSAGRMLDASRGSRSEEPLDVRWTSGVEIKLARAQRPAPAVEAAAGGPAPSTRPDAAKTKMVDYLERARFLGQVQMAQGPRRLSGDDITLAFGPPRKAGALADNITGLDATGSVRLDDADQRMSAHSLHADMRVAADGRTAPKRAEGRGEVRITQGQRQFEADHMIVEFGDSAALKASDRTRPAVSHVIADGQVSANDPVRQLELYAEQLDARLDDTGELQSAVAIGPAPDGWAYTRQGDYEVNGHHVSIDLPLQQVSVPGRGHAAFVTRRDFDGRDLSEPVRVNITFEQDMSLDGRRNFGLFNGRVHTSTETHDLKCSKRLTVRFADAPADVTNVPATASTLELPTWVRDRVGRSKPPRDRSAANSVRKRPTYVLAEGDAVALTSDFDAKQRLLSRMQITGPNVEVDLRAGRMDVPGRGTLVIEDYRPAKVGANKSSSNTPPLGAGRNDGPSQTAFWWANGMSFDTNEDLVTFDRTVQMVHLSGNQMLLKGAVPSAMAADASQLRTRAGREVRLNCDNLVAQFVSQSRRGRSRSGEVSNPLSTRWTDLRRLDAVGHVNLHEGVRTMFGDSLVFRGDTNTIILRGRPDADAMMFDENEASQHARQWRGPMILWNRATGAVEAPNPQISSR